VLGNAALSLGEMQCVVLHGTPGCRVMGKRGVWRNIEPDPKTGATRMMPAKYLVCWRQQDGVPPGAGRMLGYFFNPLRQYV
jgi:hypothetical protein